MDDIDLYIFSLKNIEQVAHLLFKFIRASDFYIQIEIKTDKILLHEMEGYHIKSNLIGNYGREKSNQSLTFIFETIIEFSLRKKDTLECESPEKFILFCKLFKYPKIDILLNTQVRFSGVTDTQVSRNCFLSK